MPTEDGNDDGADEERSYTEYQRSKNPRANDPDDAGPRDPAAEMREQAGIGSGFEDLGTDGDVEKSAQETLEDALDDWDPTGTDPLEKDEGQRVSLSLSQEDLAEASLSGEERREALLEDIKDQLKRIDGPTADAESVLQKAAADADLGKARSTADLLVSLGEELERQEALAETAKMAVEAFADEEDADLSASLSEFVTWLRGSMPNSDDLDDEGNQARRRALARLAGVENTDADTDGTPA